MRKRVKKVKAYHFWNLKQDKYGEVFYLCSGHKEIQRVPDHCFIQEIGESKNDCVRCEDSIEYQLPERRRRK